MSEEPYRHLQAFFDRAAATWDEKVTVAHAFIRRMLAATGLGRGETVLDVGCGTGVLLPGLGELVGREGRVYALDISPAMLERARVRFPDATYLCAPAEAIPLPDGTCRVVVCYSAFPHFPDQGRAMAEMARVLSPGGRLVIGHAESREAINHFHRGLGGAVADHLLPDHHTMLLLLRHAGLREITLTDGPAGYLLVAIRT
ncbi:MAG: methyltransferase domain-containing protein [Bacillota bacterium]|nr:methyltransferase domain-containing protein [Bacillota bacterium]